MKSKPKPTRADRPKKNRNHVHGICPNCGVITHGTSPFHNGNCLREVEYITVRKNQTERQLLNMALDKMCRELTFWRDGVACVLRNTDGGQCNQVIQWGHVIPQGSSAYLVHNYSNAFCQCGTHNFLHDKKAPMIYLDWYRETFGLTAYKMLKAAGLAKFEGFGIVDLYEKLADVNNLYSQRYQFGNENMATKIFAGYYGNIIREAWIKDGKI